MWFLLLLVFFSTNQAFDITMDEVRFGRDYFHPKLMKNSYQLPEIALHVETTISDDIIVYTIPHVQFNGIKVGCTHPNCDHLPVIIEYDKKSGIYTGMCLHHISKDYLKKSEPVIEKDIKTRFIQLEDLLWDE